MEQTPFNYVMRVNFGTGFPLESTFKNPVSVEL